MRQSREKPFSPFFLPHTYTYVERLAPLIHHLLILLTLATMGNQRRRRGRGASCHATLALILVLVAQQHGISAFSLNHPSARRAQPHDFRLFSSVASAADTGTTGVAGPPAIILDGLTCTHDGGTKYQLDKVSYNLPRGKRIGLVGKNGKS